MSKKGEYHDNAVAECFFNTLKIELINQQTYQTRREVQRIFEYIKVFYNKIRRHSTIDYYSPNGYEKRFYRNNTL
jgi:transposase InsO family protein